MNVDREPSWYRPNPDYHKPQAPFQLMEQENRVSLMWRRPVNAYGFALDIKSYE